MGESGRSVPSDRGVRLLGQALLCGIAGGALLLGATACPRPAQTPVQTNPSVSDEPDPSAGAMTPEQMDEVQRTVRAGMSAVTRCYTDELEKRQDRKFKGKITVKILIGTNSVAQKIDIGEDTLQAPAVSECVRKAVMGWEFPRLRKAAWFTYPFLFSPAY